ncbi:MAG: hypothetical protein NUV61_04530 [Candidatus Azambacteria bacterium]|nr:hypothetical protein [Candidatus Azambacteria bacterium]
MMQFLQQLKYKPEPVKRKIFLLTMIGFFIIVASLYVFSIRTSVAHSLSERTENTMGLPGEFRLPGLKESVTANVKDIMQGIKGMKGQ